LARAAGRSVNRMPAALTTPRSTPRRWRAFLLASVAAMVLVLAFAGTAFAGAITPEHGGSPNADDINSLYKVVLAIALVVFDGDNNPLNNAYSYQEMVVPVDTTVTLTIRAQDVAHSWWVPKLGGKFDAIPGYTNYTWFKIPGKLAGTVFRGNCAELCGRNHANMTALVKAVTPQQYEAFIAHQKA